MLRITIPSIEWYDDITNEFTSSKEQTLQLEHSLASISKWESRWKKPFLSKEEKTIEETIDYIKCMTTTQNVSDDVYKYITNDNLKEVQKYLEDGMTATTFSNNSNGSSREIITSELIYYWMISMNIPFECQKWHLNRLLTLINVCSIKNRPAKKLSGKDLAKRNAEINESRRKMLNNGG